MYVQVPDLENVRNIQSFVLDFANLSSHKGAGHNLENQSVFLTILTNVLLQDLQHLPFWHFLAYCCSASPKTSVLELVRTAAERVRSERFVLVILILT